MACPARKHTSPSCLIAMALALTLPLLLAVSVSASQFVKGGNITISKLDHIADDYYVYAQKFSADGIIDGDLTAFAYQVTVNGEVSQSANLFARSIHQNGKVNGSLRACAQLVTLSGYVSRSAVLCGQDITLVKGSIIERDVTIYGERIDLGGTVKGNTDITAARVEISGVFTGDVKIRADHITILSPAVIAGNLTYSSPNDAQIDSTAGVTISGTITREKPKEDSTDEEKAKESAYTRVILRISSLFAAFLFGIIIVYLFRPYAEESVHQVQSRFSVSVAAGLLGIFGLIMTVIILILSIALGVGGLLLVAGDLAPVGSLLLIFSILMLPVTSFLSVSGAIIFYCGKIVLGFVLGFLILQKARPGTGVLSKSALFVGLVILSLLFFIPCLGTVFYLAASVIGLGGILLGIKNCRSANHLRSDVTS